MYVSKYLIRRAVKFYAGATKQRRRAKCVGPWPSGASRAAPGSGLSSRAPACTCLAASNDASMPLTMAHEMASNGARLHSCMYKSPYLTIRVQTTGADNRRRRSVSTQFVDARRSHRRSTVSPSWSPGRLDPRRRRPKTNLTTCSTPRYCQLRKVQLLRVN
jgi:hypothetical protein